MCMIGNAWVRMREENIRPKVCCLCGSHLCLSSLFIFVAGVCLHEWGRQAVLLKFVACMNGHNDTKERTKDMFGLGGVRL